ncbi:MAG: lipopolysaccharide biosynthesis protein [Bacteroidetes bacterium HGW-Bacteroidetes-10]|nr:MAG: lipopolysaccharide biosynthesis protein [Bacteroidetes bacterium HGW-Bacteroidetes-10]
MEEREKDIITQNQADEEIDLVEIVQKLWRNRKFIIKVTIAFAVIGFLVAISTPNVYTASCTMVPQTGEKRAGGSLSGLAAMAGINLGSLSSGEVLSPTVYPKIISNINFQKELIYSKFHFKGVEQPITLYDYYTNEKYRKFSLIGTIKKYTIGLPGVIIRTIKGKPAGTVQSDSSTIKSLTIGEIGVLKIVSKNLSVNVNDKQGYVSISANMSEPILAAELAQKGQELLQKYITEFKIEKVASNLKFVERSYDESKRNFESKQAELAKYRDANKSFASAVAKTQEEKLTSEYTLLLGIYTELAKQKEQAKISVTETTPILTIIEPVVVPNEKSKPNRAMMLFSFIFLGLIIGVGVVFTVPYLEENFIPNINKHRFIPKIV